MTVPHAIMRVRHWRFDFRTRSRAAVHGRTDCGFADGIEARAARHGCRDCGFTLLELLVAIGVFALFSVMAYGGLMQVLESRDRVDVERAYWTGLSRTFLRMEDDFLHARDRAIRGVDGIAIAAFLGQPTDTRAVADPSVEFTRGGVLSLAEGPRSDLQRVAYKFQDRKILRLTWPVLDRAPTTKPQETILLQEVEDFKVQFYGPAGGWLTNWPPTGTAPPPALPRAVEVTVTLPGKGELKRVFLVSG